MNCMKGDLAVIVHCTNGENLGRLVRCVEFAPWKKFSGIEHPMNAWRLETALEGTPSGPTSFCPDAWLRPIRDQPGADEMPSAAGKPVETVRQILEEVAR